MYVPDMLDFIAELYENGEIGKIRNVMEIGAQEVFATNMEQCVERFIKAFHPNARITKDCLTALSFGTARELYRFVGCNYCCTDVIKDPDNRFNRLLFDINLDQVASIYQNKFDLVTNLGVSQHVLNQLNAFKAVHEFTTPGGYMLHYLPFTGRYDDLYFYYQPVYFEHLAKSNKYDHIGTWLYLTGDHLSSRSRVRWDVRLWEFIKFPLHLTNKYHVLAVLFRKTEDSSFRQPSPQGFPEENPGLTLSPAFFRLIDRTISSNIPERPIRVLTLGRAATSIGEDWADVAAITKEFLTPESISLPDGEHSAYLGSTIKLDEDGNFLFKHPGKRFHVICNFGASQRFIDQLGFYRFIHQIVEPEGFMVHVVPFLGYSGRGYFNYELSFFGELAYVNDYVAVWTGLLLPEGLITLHDEIFNHLRISPARHWEPLWVCVLLRKRFDREFLTPFQGFYKSIRDEAIGRHYQILRNNVFLPDDPEPWVRLSERMRAVSEKYQKVVSPPAVFSNEDFNRLAVIRKQSWEIKRKTR